MYRFPFASNVIPFALSNCALVARPPSPENPGSPVPTTVVIVPCRAAPKAIATALATADAKTAPRTSHRRRSRIPLRCRRCRLSHRRRKASTAAAVARPGLVQRVFEDGALDAARLAEHRRQLRDHVQRLPAPDHPLEL